MRLCFKIYCLKRSVLRFGPGAGDLRWSVSQAYYILKMCTKKKMTTEEHSKFYYV